MGGRGVANGDPGKPRHKMPLIQNFHQVFDLISEHGRVNVHAGGREVRPPAAPTAELDAGPGFRRTRPKRDSTWGIGNAYRTETRAVCRALVPLPDASSTNR